MSANYQPTIGPYTELEPFRYWCQKVLPTVYDDSLSYYELLSKFVDYLNKTMEDMSTAVTDITNLNESYGELQDYVNNYFDDLDVQAEINHKLDVMAANGSLSMLIQPYIVDYEADVAALSARISELESAYTPGSTSGDAELADIHVAFDSETYESAGDAVRAQAEDLYKGSSNIPVLKWKYDTYLSDSTGQELTSASHRYAVTQMIPCAKNDIFWNKTESEYPEGVTLLFRIYLYGTTVTTNDTFKEYRVWNASNVRKFTVPDGVTGIRIQFGRQVDTEATLTYPQCETCADIEVYRKGANIDEFTYAKGFTHIPNVTWQYAKYLNGSNGFVYDSASHRYAISNMIPCKPHDVFINHTPKYDSDSKELTLTAWFYGTTNTPNDTPLQVVDFERHRDDQSEIVIEAPAGATGLRFTMGRIIASGYTIEYPTCETYFKMEYYRKGVGYDDVKHDLKILFIGNSMAQEDVAYAPFIIGNMDNRVNLTVGIAFAANATINDYVDIWNNDTTIVYYYKTPESPFWSNGYTYTLREILAYEPWDVLVYQQQSAAQTTWSTFASIGSFIDATAHYCETQHNKSVKLGYLMPPVRASVETATSFDDAVDCTKKLYAATPIEFVIPVGTAIQNAKGTSLDNVADDIHLTADGIHLQEGIPCLVAGYTTALALREMCGLPYKSINYDSLEPTETWVSNKNIPGQQGDSCGVDDTNRRIAQKCAIMAIKFPDEVKTIN